MATLKEDQKIGFQYLLSLNAGQRYCRMLHLSLCFVYFKWPLKTGFTVVPLHINLLERHFLLYFLLRCFQEVFCNFQLVCFIVLIVVVSVFFHR